MKEETWGSLDVLTVEFIDEYHEIIIFYLHKFEKNLYFMALDIH